jgi:hypothetical protein
VEPTATNVAMGQATAMAAGLVVIMWGSAGRFDVVAQPKTPMIQLG